MTFEKAMRGGLGMIDGDEEAEAEVARRSEKKWPRDWTREIQFYLVAKFVVVGSSTLFRFLSMKFHPASLRVGDTDSVNVEVTNC